ncbi:permease [Lachnospiraceae bacterium KM106-2]|nr:permease [Lachnospiraceae bacterium KM106-2]
MNKNNSINTNDMKKTLFYITFTVCLLVGLLNIEVILNLFQYIIRLLGPFILGACIAFVVNIPMRIVENKLQKYCKKNFIGKHSRPISILITFIFIFTLLFVVSVLIVPEIINTLSGIMKAIPDYAEDINNRINHLAKEYPAIRDFINKLDIDWAKAGREAIHFFQNIANGIVLSGIDIIGNIVNGLMKFFIGFIFSVYLLVQKESLKRQGKQVLFAYLKEKHATHFCSFCRLTNRTFSNFISGQCTEALIIGGLFFVVLNLLQFPYALLISVFIALMSLIPIFGSYISSYTSAFLILMVNPWQALLFLLVFAVVQQFDSMFIYPHIVGGSVGLPSMWVIVAVTLGGSLMGIIGMLIFIPLFSIFYTLLRMNVYHRLKTKNLKISE